MDKDFRSCAFSSGKRVNYCRYALKITFVPFKRHVPSSKYEFPYGKVKSRTPRDHVARVARNPR